MGVLSPPLDWCGHGLSVAGGVAVTNPAPKQPGGPQPGQFTQHHPHVVTEGTLWIPRSRAGERLRQEVVTMADTAESGTVESGRRHNILNSDGQPHPLQNALTIFTLVVG